MHKGFTLVELIVVMAVLMILSVTAVVSLSNITASARSAGLKSDAATVVRQLNVYNALVPVSNRILDKKNGALDLPAAYDRTKSQIDFNDGVLTLTVISTAAANGEENLDYSVTLEPIRWGEVLEWVTYIGNGRWAVATPDK
jgi:prepilin-type N-terminal cleavage/methylation domain-containing protein